MLCFPLEEYTLTVLCATSILLQAKGRGYGTSEWSASDRLRPSLMGLTAIFYHATACRGSSSTTGCKPCRKSAARLSSFKTLSQP